VEADLRLLSHLAQFVEKEVPEARRYQPVRVVEEFRRSMMREARSRHERTTSSASERNFRGEPYV
jgi:ubiquinone biosynthesis protein